MRGNRIGYNTLTYTSPVEGEVKKKWALRHEEILKAWWLEWTIITGGKGFTDTSDMGHRVNSFV